MRESRASTGRRAEEQAAEFLRKKGYEVLARNYRTRTAEVDIIARRGETVVFVEVKCRAYDDFGSPELAVNRRKREKIRQAALHYLAANGLDCPARFDVVSILPRGIEHIPDAFEIS